MGLLELVAAEKHFTRRDGSPVRAVDGVTLHVDAGETVAIIGESGSGKSTVARLALGLLTCDAGTACFEDTDLARADGRTMRGLRCRMTAVFQEPYESLNPRMDVEAIVEEPLRIHRLKSRRGQRERAVAEALEQVGLAGSFSRKYPGELSGGQQQRVSLARAIVTQPRLVVLDEPTSSLDLSVQAQVLRLLLELRERLGMSYLFITHDIGVAEYLAHRIAVMHLGKVVEEGPTQNVVHHPQHSYTQTLLGSVLAPRPPG